MPIFECSRCNQMTYSATAGARAVCERCGSKRQRIIEGGFDEARHSVRSLGPGDHAVLLYDDAASVAPFCARFLTDGVNRGERVVAGLQEDLREAVCALLGPDVELTVEWQHPRSLYGDFDPELVASKYEALIESESRTTRIIAGFDEESAEGVAPAELARYEEMAHAIITSHGATVVCVFDRDTLLPDFVDAGSRRHGLTIENGAVRRNERFEYQPA